ncbi:unnamed protein product [Lampetra planeri]
MDVGGGRGGRSQALAPEGKGGGRIAVSRRHDLFNEEDEMRRRRSFACHSGGGWVFELGGGVVEWTDRSWVAQQGTEKDGTVAEAAMGGGCDLKNGDARGRCPVVRTRGVRRGG